METEYVFYPEFEDAETSAKPVKFNEFQTLYRGIVDAKTTYQNSFIGTVPPTGGEWARKPDPIKGQYVWAKTEFIWQDGQIKEMYTVSYIGTDDVAITDKEIDALFDNVDPG